MRASKEEELEAATAAALQALQVKENECSIEMAEREREQGSVLEEATAAQEQLEFLMEQKCEELTVAMGQQEQKHADRMEQAMENETAMEQKHADAIEAARVEHEMAMEMDRTMWWNRLLDSVAGVGCPIASAPCCAVPCRAVLLAHISEIRGGAGAAHGEGGGVLRHGTALRHQGARGRG